MIKRARQLFQKNNSLRKGSPRGPFFGLLLLCAMLFTSQALATIHELDATSPAHVECSLCAASGFNHHALDSGTQTFNFDRVVQHAASFDTPFVTDATLLSAKARAPPRY